MQVGSALNTAGQGGDGGQAGLTLSIGSCTRLTPKDLDRQLAGTSLATKG